MISGDKDDNVKRAILADADDVLIKPVSPEKMMERVAQSATKRLPFIVTIDYVGPEPEAGSEPSIENSSTECRQYLPR